MPTPMLRWDIPMGSVFHTCHDSSGVGSGSSSSSSSLSTPQSLWQLVCNRMLHMHMCTLQRILVCGWGEPTFMSNLLRELDHGPAALPRNSEVVMFNRLETEQQQAMLSVSGGQHLPCLTTPCWA